MAYALAHATSPLIGTAVGPLKVFLLHAVMAIAGLVLLYFAASEPIRSGDPLSLAEFIRAVRNPSIVLVALSAFTMYALYLFLNAWVPVYGTDVLS
jgi:hypothetical protein